MTFSRIVSFDFLLIILENTLEPVSARTALRILSVLLSAPSKTISPVSVFRNRGGFASLSRSLVRHCSNPDVYTALIALMVHRTVDSDTLPSSFTIQSLISFFNTPELQINCLDILITVMEMLRALAEVNDSDDNEISSTVFMFLTHLLETVPSFSEECVRRPIFLTAVVDVLFAFSAHNPMNQGVYAALAVTTSASGHSASNSVAGSSYSKPSRPSKPPKPRRDLFAELHDDSAVFPITQVPPSPSGQSIPSDLGDDDNRSDASFHSARGADDHRDDKTDATSLADDDLARFDEGDSPLMQHQRQLDNSHSLLVSACSYSVFEFFRILLSKFMRGQKEKTPAHVAIETVLECPRSSAPFTLISAFRFQVLHATRKELIDYINSILPATAAAAPNELQSVSTSLASSTVPSRDSSNADLLSPGTSTPTHPPTSPGVPQATGLPEEQGPRLSFRMRFSSKIKATFSSATLPLTPRQLSVSQGSDLAVSPPTNPMQAMGVKFWQPIIKIVTKLVEKVYEGVLVQDGSLRTFLSTVITKIESEERSGMFKIPGRGLDSNLNDLYRSFNRLILHPFQEFCAQHHITPWLPLPPEPGAASTALVSSDTDASVVPHHSSQHVPDSHKRDMVKHLQSMFGCQRTIFSANNTDADFFACLCCYLFVFVEDSDKDLRASSLQLFKLMIQERAGLMQQFLSVPATVTKRPQALSVFEQFSETLPQRDHFEKFGQFLSENVNTVHTIMHYTIGRTLKAYESQDGKARIEQLKAAQTRQQAADARLQKSRDEEDHHYAKTAAERVVLAETARVKHSERIKMHRSSLLTQRSFVDSTWKRQEADLFRERALFGNESEERRDRVVWMLDFTEGSHRMRKKMKRADATRYGLDYPHYHSDNPAYTDPVQLRVPPVPPPSANTTLTTIVQPAPSPSPALPPHRGAIVPPELTLSSPDTSVASPPTAIRQNSSLASPTEALPPAIVVVDDVDDPTAGGASAPSALKEEAPEDDPEDADDLGGDAEEDEDSSDTTILTRILQPGDVVRHRWNCARVAGMEKCVGVLLIGGLNIYVVEGYTFSSAGSLILLTPENVSDFGGMEDAVINSFDHRHWSLRSIKQVHIRRYLLLPVALEIFFDDGRTNLLVFKSKQEREQAYKTLLELSPGSEPMPLKQATSAWASGAMTNFEYLMHLNTVAGRSYNDLTQYPVFPWVLSDFHSDTLNLNNPAVFRDLSKPMGAQTQKRMEVFLERYESWDDPAVPKFHYGTHYSSAAIVLFFLLRLEPFSQHLVRLQSGRFDHPDRLFHSIPETFTSCSALNASDVKELIPEFFYLPEFLQNKNGFDFGRKSTNDMPVGDVKLPPWCRGDFFTFIRMHREALECEYVSEHLHEWIDLIFGYKQQGPAAAEAVNVFYHLTYEGAVDIESIEDPVVRAATIAQISNFGQTPSRLFDKPHPPRRHPIPVATPTFDRMWATPSAIVAKEMGEPISDIKPINEITRRGLLAATHSKLLIPPQFNRVVAWGFGDDSVRLINDGHKVLSCHEDLHDGPVTCACLSRDGQTLVTGGGDTVVRIWSATATNAEQPAAAGSAALTNPGGVVGGAPGTAGPASGLSQVSGAVLPAAASVAATVAATITAGPTPVINAAALALPLASLVGHRLPVSCVAIAASLGVVVSGSQDCTCIVWDLNRLSYVQQLIHTAPLVAVAINDRSGEILTCTREGGHVWSVNGDKLGIFSASGDPITCCAVVEDPEWLLAPTFVTGHQSGQLRLWSHAEMEPRGPTTDLSLVACWKDQHHAAITALFVNTEQKKLYSGDSAGRIVYWFVE
eukprot:TRINITY_DN1935_c0_g1_i6.p1 TRINITY_DN1935_c0_g1~~TRINITY_DN1935_c0_g1_i6.p1  ORF type:complete len:1836 (-),score=377.69 TRINITY_DN1935_c0_g1_i6:25-5445(-)